MDDKDFGNKLLWIVFGIPAILSWIAVGVVWLVGPRFGVDPNLFDVALYTAGAWYGLWLFILFIAHGGGFLL